MFASSSYRLQLALLSGLLIFTNCSGGSTLTDPSLASLEESADEVVADVTATEPTEPTEEETPIENTTTGCFAPEDEDITEATGTASDEILTVLNDETTPPDATATDPKDGKTGEGLAGKIEDMPNRFRLKKWREHLAELKAEKAEAGDVAEEAETPKESDKPSLKEGPKDKLTKPELSEGLGNVRDIKEAKDFKIDDLMAIKPDKLQSLPDGLKDLLIKKGTNRSSRNTEAEDDDSGDLELPNKDGSALLDKAGELKDSGALEDKSAETLHPQDEDKTERLHPRIAEFVGLYKSLNESVASDLLDILVEDEVDKKAIGELVPETENLSVKPLGQVLDTSIKQLNDAHVRLIGRTGLKAEDTAEQTADGEVKADLKIAMDAIQSHFDSVDKLDSATAIEGSQLELQVEEVKPLVTDLKPKLETLRSDLRSNDLNQVQLQAKIMEVTQDLTKIRDTQLLSQAETLKTSVSELETAGADTTSQKLALTLVEEKIADNFVAQKQAATADSVFSALKQQGIEVFKAKTQAETLETGDAELAAEAAAVETEASEEEVAATEGAAATEETDATAKKMRAEASSIIEKVEENVKALGDTLMTRTDKQASMVDALSKATGGSQASDTATATLKTRQAALLAIKEAAAAKKKAAAELKAVALAATATETEVAAEPAEAAAAEAVVDAEEAAAAEAAVAAEAVAAEAAPVAEEVALVIEAVEAPGETAKAAVKETAVTVTSKILRASTLSTTSTSTDLKIAIGELNATSAITAKAKAGAAITARKLAAATATKK